MSSSKCEFVKEGNEETRPDDTTMVVPKIEDEEAFGLPSADYPEKNEYEDHKRHPDPQLEDVLKQHEAAKENSSSQEQLKQANKTIEMLKCEMSKLKSHVKITNDVAKRWKMHWTLLNEHYNNLKKTTNLEVQELYKEMQSYRNKALESELLILELKATVGQNKIVSKVTEAMHNMERLSRIINQSNTFFSSTALHENYTEFYDYMERCVAIKINLEANYLRLKNCIRNCHQYDISLIDVCLPTLPQLCVQASQIIENESQINNGYVLPPYTEYEAPPPYSRYEIPPDNQVPLNWVNEEPPNREN